MKFITHASIMALLLSLLSFNSFAQLSFKEQSLSAIAMCDGENIIINSEHEILKIAIVNAPASGNTEINEDFFTNECLTCCAIQLSDKDGNSFRAISGNFTRNGNDINFEVEVIDEENQTQKFSFSGKTQCEQL